MSIAEPGLGERPTHINRAGGCRNSLPARMIKLIRAENNITKTAQTLCNGSVEKLSGFVVLEPCAANGRLCGVGNSIGIDCLLQTRSKMSRVL